MKSIFKSSSVTHSQSDPVAVKTDATDKNPMRKIILMVGFAILVFIGFMLYSLQTSIKNSAQLSAIKDLYFPVLERVDANIVRLDKIEESMIQAVMTGERGELQNAKDLSQLTEQVFLEIQNLYTLKATEVSNLRDGFKRYFELANATTTSLLETRGDDKSGLSAQMNHELEALRSNIRQFRTASYENFVNTLLQSQHSATVNLYLGIAVGVMNLIFMAVLVYFIRNNISMMAVIAEQNATLEKRVTERTAALNQKTNDINAMLHNMNLGVCTIVPGNTLHHEYSHYLRIIFAAEDFANQDVLRSLFQYSSLGVDAKDQITVALESILGEDLMMFDFNSHLLVREMRLELENQPAKILQLSWSPIVNQQEIVEKLLLMVQDVTELRALELKSSHQKEDLEIISQIIKIAIGKFNDFITSAQQFIQQNRDLIQQTSTNDPEVIAALFRNMHTIKGNARTFEFNFITNAAHAAEQEYDHLRKDSDAAWDSERLISELDAVEAAIARYLAINEDKLGRKGRASDLFTTRGCFVSHAEITELKNLAAKFMTPECSEELHILAKNIHKLGFVPLERLVTGAMDASASLALELNKPTPQYKIVDGNIAFHTQFAEALKSSFLHIVRNSLDHGIEAPEARKKAHKAEPGELRFSCVKQNGHMELHISDDGRGLALHKLHEKGLAAGLFSPELTPTADAIAEVIFNSGLSTAEQVTQVSGRGVGMDAVRSFLKEHGAEIRIVLTDPAPQIHFAPFKFVISLPASTYVI